ncbi:MAG: cytochrome d ubiquinol oxidase subunit II [Planctomycetota bacterium]
MDLNTIWFILVGVLFTGYAVLDGFDLGVGALHLLARTDEERRLSINAIGPVWDGNEVWLVTGGGALFAAFPEVYASVFSGFYVAFFLFLAALVFRAVAIEFRSKQQMRWWRGMWDVSFSVASVMAALLLGVAMGNVVWGVPLNASGHFPNEFSFFSLLRPYALLMGLTTVALFTMHGAIYLYLKTEGEMQRHVKQWIRPSIIAFVVLYALLSLATLIYVPQATARVREQPLLFLVVVVSILAIADIPREIFFERPMRAFLASCLTMASLMALFGLNVFPDLVHSRPNPDNSLDIYNAASSQKTLFIMLVIAIIGVPLVLSYTASIYWVFRGKVRLNEASY